MMKKKESNLDRARKQAEASLTATNAKIKELGDGSSGLYESLGTLQGLFDRIRNVPEESGIEYEEIKKIRLSWKQQADKIKADYEDTKVKQAGKGAIGTGVGVAVVAMGPTAAMGVATTFGVASTGTAISALSGAAATNAALAWLGGGALAAGGGGMAAGQTFLALAGPVGWAIAGVTLLGSGITLLKSRANKKRLENVFALISERDSKSYDLAIVELNERIIRIGEEMNLIKDAVIKTESFGTDYSKMSEAQQYELGSYVNLMKASTQLLINPILGLQPKYTEDDMTRFERRGGVEHASGIELIVIYLCNLLYGIELDDKDRKLLYKSIRKNKELLSQAGLDRKGFPISAMDIVEQALTQKYESQETAL